METLTETQRIPIEDADFPTLKQFAELSLGLEVKTGTNASALRSKILAAAPGMKDVPPLPAPPAPIVPAVQDGFGPSPAMVEAAKARGFHAETENPELRPAAVSPRASTALRSPKHDPKVSLTISRTDDKRRAREVTVEVNGVTWRMQRGKQVDVPYRVYEALENAKEMQPVPTDDVHPITGLPIMAFEEVYSYPFMVHSMPSAEEIAAWHASTDAGFANALNNT